ncbi:MAG: type II toxin-antitoxin system RelE/ParE family toxin [Desulfobacterales bacterium]|nr:type II toxin-antitoxin system RelE/ParE family toxin [Desulfobacterales bacterium]
MPRTEVKVFAEDDGSCPFLVWMDSLPQKAQEKCIVKVERLAEMGHELRRPEADYLQDKVYELRAAFQGIQYRMLYFFHGSRAVISHGLVKEREVPSKEIELAMNRMKRFVGDPSTHTHRR